MTLVYVLVCSVPFLFIILTFLLIGAVSMRAYRAGKEFYIELQPSIERLKKSTEQAQSKSKTISDKSQGISDTFEELSGRLSFLHETYEEVMDSPAVRVASMAGRVRGKK